MPRTITAWAVVDKDGNEIAIYNEAAKSLALDVANRIGGRTVVGLTGELRDPPKTVKVGTDSWVRDDDGYWRPDSQRWGITVNELFDRIWELENGGGS